VAIREETFYDPLAPAPAFVLGWKIPVRRTPEFYALSLAGTLLFEGDSSRLYQKLVKGDESVVSIEGGVDERRGPSALYIFALPKPGEDVNKIREQIFDEINESPRMDQPPPRWRNFVIHSATMPCAGVNQPCTGHSDSLSLRCTIQIPDWWTLSWTTISASLPTI
jgi:hypothetical protein